MSRPSPTCWLAPQPMRRCRPGSGSDEAGSVTLSRFVTFWLRPSRLGPTRQASRDSDCAGPYSAPAGPRLPARAVSESDSGNVPISRVESESRPGTPRLARPASESDLGNVPSARIESELGPGAYDPYESKMNQNGQDAIRLYSGQGPIRWRTAPPWGTDGPCAGGALTPWQSQS